jgi:transcriptional regulator with XRE-family HTH domain
MNFGSYFRELRKSKHKTQEEIAVAIGKSKMLISGVETGRNQSFAESDIEKICKTLELTDVEKKELFLRAAKARGTLPAVINEYLFEHDDLTLMISNMASEKVNGDSLDRIIKYVEGILNVKNN